MDSMERRDAAARGDETRAAEDGDWREWAARLDRLMEERWRDETDGSHDIAHVRRVVGHALTIADGEPIAPDRLVLVAAATLHDLVPMPKSAPDRHLASTRSADAARALLAEEGFDLARLDAVAHAIAAHSFSAGIEPRTQEARVLRDADRLESMGAMGIARTFYVAGRLGSRLFDDSDPAAERRPLDDRTFALDHFRAKLLGLADTMTTTTGRRLAEQRTAFMLAFYEQMLNEAAVTIPATDAMP